MTRAGTGSQASPGAVSAPASRADTCIRAAAGATVAGLAAWLQVCPGCCLAGCDVNELAGLLLPDGAVVQAPVQVGGDQRPVPCRSRNGDEQRDAVLVRLAAGGQGDGVVTGDGPPGEDAEAAVADRRRWVGLMVMGEARRAVCVLPEGSVHASWTVMISASTSASAASKASSRACQSVFLPQMFQVSRRTVVIREVFRSGRRGG